MEQLTFDTVSTQITPDNIMKKLQQVVNDLCQKYEVDTRYVKVIDLDEEKKRKSKEKREDISKEDQITDDDYIIDETSDKNNKRNFSVWIIEPLKLEAENKVVKSDRCFKLTYVKNAKSDYIRVEYLFQRKDHFNKPDDAIEKIYTSTAKGKKAGETFTKKTFCHQFDVNSPSLIPYLSSIIDFTLKNYRPAERFGCCEKYVACSDAKKCLHRNNFYARCCWYRQNLEAGRIFYGKNKTIPD